MNQGGAKRSDGEQGLAKIGSWKMHTPLHPSLLLKVAGFASRSSWGYISPCLGQMHLVGTIKMMLGKPWPFKLDTTSWTPLGQLCKSAQTHSENNSQKNMSNESETTLRCYEAQQSCNTHGAKLNTKKSKVQSQ